MLNFISTVGHASATLNFTDDLSVFLSGLVGLVWLSAGMIVYSALREAYSEKAKLAALTSSHAVDYRLAA
jgi:hypothetical protein